MDKLSVISFAFVRMLEAGIQDLFGYLESCRYRYGLSAADIWDGSLISLDEDYLLRVRDALNERGLALACLAADGANLWADDPSQRQSNQENALRLLRAAEILGARTVRFNSGGDRGNTTWSDEQYDHVLGLWRSYAQRAYDNGYRVGPENHWGPESVPSTLKQLCEEVDSPGFGVLLHFARWNGPDAAQGDELLAPWAMHTHITTRLEGPSLAPAMEIVRDRGYEGYWGIEVVSERYTDVGLWIARVRNVLEIWRREGRPL
jgi:hypothetical protein